IIILDNDGNRIMAKYYNQLFSTVKEQKEFEKSLFNKTHKGSGDVILLDNMTIVYRNNVDLLFYVMGSTNENELMLSAVLSCLFESLSTMLRKNVEKRHVYDNLDLVMLTIDEICDEGIILEADPIMIIQRVQLRQDDIPLGEQTVAQTLSTLSAFHPVFIVRDESLVRVFLLLGLCNNFGYVVMLSAAHDILRSHNHNGTNHNSTDPTPTTNITNRFDCNKLSTGHTVSAWSSGTGAAGLLGSLSYAGMTTLLHISPQTTMLILLFIPVLEVISYFMIGASSAAAKHSHYEAVIGKSKQQTNSEQGSEGEEEEDETKIVTPLSPRRKLDLIKPLLKYMIPLTLVYFAEYLINQGLYELIFFRNVYIGKELVKHDEQYRWFSVDYQLGVFISRSSVSLFRVKYLFILPIIQFINLILFFLCVFRTAHIPSIWLVFALVLWEGLIGGCAYVNTFYKITNEIPERDREFSMGVASIGDSVGITIAGFSAIPLHNRICSSG
ncbi:unnamed protein product, partial [Didymodactylos carnosus]